MAEEIKIKPFKNSSIDYWVGYVHYRFENKEIKFICGGIENEEHKNKLKAYLKRKKLL